MARDAGVAGAGLIRVTTTAPTAADDGLCSLSEALAASAGRTAVDGGDCPAGTGDDVIELPSGTYELLAPIALAHGVELRGAGAGLTTLAFTGASGTCAVKMEALRVGQTAALTHLTVRPSATSGGTPIGITGVCVRAGTLRVEHARVTGFTGGGLRAAAPTGGDAKLEILNALIDDNSNDDDGGGISFVGRESSISIAQSSIVNNRSAGRGGGLFAAGGTNANYILNTTFSGNVARRGGAIAANILDLTYFGLYWCTIVRNHALEAGGGLDLEGESLDAHGTVTNSIVAENHADGDPAQANLNADWATGLSCTSSFLDVAALARKPANLAASCNYDGPDLRLGPLMDMGGADHLPLHPLLPGSPAIDAVTDERPFGILEQRDSWNGGSADPPIGTAPGQTPRWSLFGDALEPGARFDTGAYEFHPLWQMELLTVVERSISEQSVQAGTPDLSHGAAIDLRAGSAGERVVYQVPVPEPGRHHLSLRLRAGAAGGRFQVAVAEAMSGPYVAVGAENDGYAAEDEWRIVDLGAAEFSSPGQKFIALVVTGKREASAGFRMLLDYLAVTKP